MWIETIQPILKNLDASDHSWSGWFWDEGLWSSWRQQTIHPFPQLGVMRGASPASYHKHIFAFYHLTSFDHQSWQFSPCISFANHGHEKGKHTRVKRSILPVADSMIILNKLPWEMRWIGIPCWNWKSQIVVFNGFLLVFPCYSDWRKAECIIGLDHASGKMVRQNTLRMYCWIMLLLHEECVRC